MSNYHGRFYTVKEEIREALLSQIVGTVKWVENMDQMIALPINNFIEMGPNKVLKGLARNINKDTNVENISTDIELNEFVKKYSEV